MYILYLNYFFVVVVKKILYLDLFVGLSYLYPCINTSHPKKNSLRWISFKIMVLLEDYDQEMALFCLLLLNSMS